MAAGDSAARQDEARREGRGMSARQDRRASTPDADPELRLWAVEQVSASANLDTLKDVAKICELVEALASFVTTGDRPIGRSPTDQMH
jgi:hypothetical protein